MKLALIIAALALFCSPARADGGPKLTDAQKIALLRAEAHKRGLTWGDFCAREYTDTMTDPVDKQFMAEAWITGTHAPPGYIEDGVKDWWAEWGRTQADAAYHLYLAIQKRPDMKVGHSPEVKAKKMMCPPELRGD